MVIFPGSLSRCIRSRARPIATTAVVDMSGAVLDTVLAQLGMESEVCLLSTPSSTRREEVNAVFLVLPRQQHFGLIVDRLPK